MGNKPTRSFKAPKGRKIVRKGFVWKGPSFWEDINRRKVGRTKRLYLTVSETRLCYFKSDSKAHGKLCTDSSRVKLTKVTNVEANEAATNQGAGKFCFLVTTDERTLFFWAPTEQDRERWINSIQKSRKRADSKAALRERTNSFKDHVAEHAPAEATRIKPKAKRVQNVNDRVAKTTEGGMEAALSNIEVQPLHPTQWENIQHKHSKSGATATASASDPYAAMLNKLLDRRAIIFFSVEWHVATTATADTQPPDRYLFEVKEAETQISMQVLHKRWKKQARANESSSVSPAATRDNWLSDARAQYLGQLSFLQKQRQPCIAVLRMQMPPEDIFAPPKFGDLIVVWTPNGDKDSGALRLKDRAVGVPLVLTALEKWLTSKGVLSGYRHTKDAQTTKQGPSEKLEFESSYKKLFKSGTAIDCALPPSPSVTVPTSETKIELE